MLSEYLCISNGFRVWKVNKSQTPGAIAASWQEDEWRHFPLADCFVRHFLLQKWLTKCEEKTRNSGYALKNVETRDFKVSCWLINDKGSKHLVFLEKDAFNDILNPPASVVLDKGGVLKRTWKKEFCQLMQLGFASRVSFRTYCTQ